MNFKEKSVVFLATGGYIGKIPFAPGTMGTIPGILLCFLFSKLDLLWAVLFGIIFIVYCENGEFFLFIGTIVNGISFCLL